MENRESRRNRRERKSSEGEFIYELENSYELSPKLSEQILISAKECLIRKEVLKEGQIEVTVIEQEEKAGKVIEKMGRKKVKLTIDAGIEDEEIHRSYGRIALRQAKIERITEEAMEQGGVLSQEDLSKYLGVTIRTIQRDIVKIKEREIEIITRGYLHNIGRGQTHKVKIIGMYLDGKTYSEIKTATRHSIGAIKRYIESFSKVLAAGKRGIKQVREISSVTGMSEYLIKQYMELLRESRRDKIRRENIEALVSRMGMRAVRKKTTESYIGLQAAMMRGI